MGRLLRRLTLARPASVPYLGTMPAAPLLDSFGRRITYLRLSVTDRCDLRCRYCMAERVRFLPKDEVLSLEELEAVATAFIARGVTKLRVTGGEPLVRREVPLLVERLGAHLGRGLDEITLTTNATQLANHADRLFAAGVRRVNVSLDTLDPDVFARLTRRAALPQVLDGIAAAQAAGLTVKLNTVALAGTNEHEIPHLIRWAHARAMDLTLIEVMPMGEVEDDRTDQFLPLSAVRERLEREFTLTPSAHATGGPARYYDVTETGGRLGLITPLTSNFCAGCNRVRVTCTGQLYPCLGGGERIDLRAALRGPEPGRALADALDRAMRIKPERHGFEDALAGGTAAVTRTMAVTGG